MLRFIKTTQCDKLDLQINDNTENRIKEYLSDKNYNQIDTLVTISKKHVITKML